MELDIYSWTTYRGITPESAFSNYICSVSKLLDSRILTVFFQWKSFPGPNGQRSTRSRVSPTQLSRCLLINKHEFSIDGRQNASKDSALIVQQMRQTIATLYAFCLFPPASKRC
ncbi:uncharacterized protein LOC114717387 [Neltuma alba]|uniref:uncharacterized protein LOC114717387 n=1 Tax=Neltuma alba TaxID=207710 RepID=UPI0010A427FB|nr:uncharacterized protein LOC114717387 [Prosopis alba]